MLYFLYARANKQEGEVMDTQDLDIAIAKIVRMKKFLAAVLHAC